MAIYFRFKSAKEFQAMPIQGPFITVLSFKQSIFQLKRMEKGTDYDILVSNAQTDEEYADNDDSVIHKNTAVVIRRVPGLPRKPIVVERDEGPAVSAVSPATTSSGSQDGTNSHKSKMCRPLPRSGYVCRRCMVPGHFIQHCPTNGDPSYDLNYKNGAAADSFEANQSAVHKKNQRLEDRLPELCCPLCKGVMKNAVFARKCCFRSFCDACVQECIISKTTCFCGVNNISEDDFIPNITLRDAITRILGSAASTNASPVQDRDSANLVKAGEGAKATPPRRNASEAGSKVASTPKENKLMLRESAPTYDAGNGMPLAPNWGYCRDQIMAQCYMMSALLPSDLSELAFNSMGMGSVERDYKMLQGMENRGSSSRKRKCNSSSYFNQQLQYDGMNHHHKSLKIAV